MDIFKQFDKAIHSVGNQPFALFRCRGGGVSGSPVRVEIAHQPAEGVWAIGAQVFEAAGEIALAGGEAGGLCIATRSG